MQKMCGGRVKGPRNCAVKKSGMKGRILLRISQSKILEIADRREIACSRLQR